MSVGKIAGQASHASLGIFFDRMRFQRGSIISGPSLGVTGVLAKAKAEEEGRELTNEEIAQIEADENKPFVTRKIWECIMTEDMDEWKRGAFAKIVLSATEEQMRIIAAFAEDADVPVCEINDNGVTEVEPGSLTAMAIGPYDTTNSAYYGLTGQIKQLKLLK
jgi:peptidyl-tRNA hydrolase